MKIILDPVSPFWYFPEMGISIIKTHIHKNSFRITLPHNVIKAIRWRDVSHVALEVVNDNTLILRRFLDGKALEGDDKSS